MLIIDDITFSYNNSKDIFDGANLEVSKGEFVFIVGESGIGKTTLLKLIYSELIPRRGAVLFDEFDTRKIDINDLPLLRRKIGIIFQDYKLFPDRNVFDNISAPLYISGVKKDLIKKLVYNVASKVGLLDRLKNMPYDLSGGEQQRVAIARAIVNEPLMILADEPTGNLDPFISIDIIKLLDDINKTGTTIIIATHNFEIVRRFRDKRIIQIKQKKLFDVMLKK